VARAPRYDVPKAAPEPLRLVQAFVNTADKEHGREWLATAGDLRRWLVDRELLRPPSARVRLDDLERAHEVREALRSMIRLNAQSSAAASSVIEGAAREARLTLRFEQERTKLVAEARGSAGALGTILAVVHGAMIDGSWGRLKSCPRCGWAFYDYSRNRSAAWCSMQLCGNRMKTRSYYRRRTAGHSA
jgi:predicted RNA-binding Zn ribbon-like protein